MTNFPDLASIGDVIKGIWTVTEQIGQGGFGQVYKGEDEDGYTVAIKTESTEARKQVLKMEVAVLRKLEGCPYVCELFGCGRNETFNYVVMTLQGKSLSALKRETNRNRFTIGTTLLICDQMLSGIQAMHEGGFLHRDIKPSNFSMGIGANKRTVILLDFGLARQFMKSDGEMHPPRSYAGFRGTVRYASVNVHKGRDLGRHDDLWSLFYLMAEFTFGKLPWRDIEGKDRVGAFKQRYDNHSFLTYMPHEMEVFLEHLENLTYWDKPDYDMLHEQFRLAMERKRVYPDSPYDWEKQPRRRKSAVSGQRPRPPHNRSEGRLVRRKSGVSRRRPPRTQTRSLPSGRVTCDDEDEEENQALATGVTGPDATEIVMPTGSSMWRVEDEENECGDWQRGNEQ